MIMPFSAPVRIASAWLVAFGITGSSAWVEQTSVTDDVRQGKRLALLICANCHIVARDQPFEPILRPPAPSFESIAQRSIINADALQTFLTTTQRDISNPHGMPNLQLVDYQIKALTAYALSLPSSPENVRLRYMLLAAPTSRSAPPSGEQ
jgi:mono/diheme cytochrome c family protein